MRWNRWSRILISVRTEGREVMDVEEEKSWRSMATNGNKAYFYFLNCVEFAGYLTCI